MAFKPKYQANYCEENIWHLASEPDLQDQERFGQHFRPVMTACFLLSKNIQAKTHFGKSYCSLIGHMILHVRVIILKS